MNILSKRPNPEYEQVKAALPDNMSGEVKERILAQFTKREQKVRRNIERARRIGDLPFATLAIFSAIVSLGALLYSGFYPDNQINCFYIVLVLFFSYLSVMYNIIYFTVAVRINEWALSVTKHRLEIK